MNVWHFTKNRRVLACWVPVNHYCSRMLWRLYEIKPCSLACRTYIRNWKPVVEKFIKLIMRKLIPFVETGDLGHLQFSARSLCWFLSCLWNIYQPRLFEIAKYQTRCVTEDPDVKSWKPGCIEDNLQASGELYLTVKVNAKRNKLLKVPELHTRTDHRRVTTVNTRALPPKPLSLCFQLRLAVFS